MLQTLTKAGFNSKVRQRQGNSWAGSGNILAEKRQQKEQRLREATWNLVVAWGLSLVCGLGHLAHVLPSAPAWMHALHHPLLSAGLSAAALLGECWGTIPGQQQCVYAAGCIVARLLRCAFTEQSVGSTTVCSSPDTPAATGPKIHQCMLHPLQYISALYTYPQLWPCACCLQALAVTSWHRAGQR
jgi:hypothetical protein